MHIFLIIGLFIGALWVIGSVYNANLKIKKTEQLESQIVEVIPTFQKHLIRIQDWLGAVNQTVSDAREKRYWITCNKIKELDNLYPEIPIPRSDIVFYLNNPKFKKCLGSDFIELNESYTRWLEKWSPDWKRLNEEFLVREIKLEKSLLDRLEKLPLTEEQARSVITFDNKVQTIASAGSGKTSVMVAKAGYAITRRIVLPEQIVMLAFNKKASDELSERLKRSLERIELECEVKTATFHSLGLEIIGKATGKKPDVPEWVVNDRKSLDLIEKLIKQIKKDSLKFSMNVVLFGTTPYAGSEDERRSGGYQTLQGEFVHSKEELLIANWLYCHHVDYEYERPYEVDTTTDNFRRYKPDFFYPRLNLYHEHLALDKNGHAPEKFHNYEEGVIWKREIHKKYDTSLIETHSYQLYEGTLFKHLEASLLKHGAKLNFDPSRESKTKQLEVSDLAKLIRTFICHVKNNRLSSEDLIQRVSEIPISIDRFRSQTFLKIAIPILNEWNQCLKKENALDFEDMLNRAADLVESGKYKSPYKLVMADEFQDSSKSRARLCRALTANKDSFFYAVGDDWQSINRFAGSDLSVMTNFREYYGDCEQLKLERTFRCPQDLCEISSTFIMQNPQQIRKTVFSEVVNQRFSVKLIEVLGDRKNRGKIFVLNHAVEKYLDSLITHDDFERNSSVYILGRYNADKPVQLRKWQNKFKGILRIEFMTIHKSKGSEADYIILPAMISTDKGRSFPCTMTDDPVLSLAMPDEDRFIFSEERRLFYVALTRARKSVTLFTLSEKCSDFFKELRKEDKILQDSIYVNMGSDITEESGGNCPACEAGSLLERHGRYGRFYGCSNYPQCDYTQHIEAHRSILPLSSRVNLSFQDRYDEYEYEMRYSSKDLNK